MESEYGIVGHDSIDASHYPLTWVASPGRELWVKLEYRPDVVDRADAQRLLDRLRQAMLQIADGATTLAARSDAAARRDRRAGGARRFDPPRPSRRHRDGPARRALRAVAAGRRRWSARRERRLRSAGRTGQPPGVAAAAPRHRSGTDRCPGDSALDRRRGRAVRGAAGRRRLPAAGAGLPGRATGDHARRRGTGVRADDDGRGVPHRGGDAARLPGRRPRRRRRASRTAPPRHRSGTDSRRRSTNPPTSSTPRGRPASPRASSPRTAA